MFRDTKLRSIQPVFANLLAVHMFEIVADMEPQAVELQGIQHFCLSSFREKQAERESMLI